jgi:hypothetical protein
VEFATQKPVPFDSFYKKAVQISFKKIGSIFSDIKLKLIIRKNTTNIMRSILYIIAVILIIGWLLGVFYWSATGLIHILIVLAIIALLLGIIRRA